MILLLITSLLFACQKKEINTQVEEKITSIHPSSEILSGTTLHEHFISPASTDPAINTALASHYAAVREGEIRNVLFVFLPGSYRDPKTCNAINKKAARLGFHSIGLMYPNSKPINPLCKNTNDITCHRRARHEVIDGIDRHPSVSVDPSNSILNRLYKLLVHLQARYPNQGWGQYISGGKPNWSKIIVAGHSQGGACAGLIGKLYPIKKVIMFSMIDYMTNGQMPDWQTMPLNKEKFFALTNTMDELVPYQYVKQGWVSLGMTAYGGRINVDWTSYPYTGTHTLVTSVHPLTTQIDKYHNSTAVDSYIPKTLSGKYIYEKVWEYLLLN